MSELLSERKLENSRNSTSDIGEGCNIFTNFVSQGPRQAIMASAFIAMEQIWDPLRKKNVALTPEEVVRQWFIGVLCDQLKVPLYMMMSEASMKFGQKPFRADILVYGRDTAPLMVVECKRQDVEMTKEVLEQALKYNMALGSRYIAITNGRKTFGFARKGDAYVQMKALPDWETMQKED